MGLEKNRENLKENDGEDEIDNHIDYDDERTQFILPSSQTRHHRLSSGVSIISMADPQSSEAAGNPTIPVEVPVVGPDKGTPATAVGGQRRNSVQSIISNAQIQLQMIVQDVKGELKELAVGNNNSIKTKLTDDIEKTVGENDHHEVQKTKKLVKGGDEGKEKTVRTGWRRYIGIILGITSSMLFALTILIVKLLAKDYHPYSVSFWRFQGVLLPTFPIVIYYRLVKKQKIFDMVCPPNAPGHAKTLLFVLVRI